MTFWKWLRLVHSGKDEASSKRFYGGIIIILTLGILFLVVWGICPTGTWGKIEGTVQYVFTVGASLIGLNTIIDLYKIRKEKK